MKALRFLFLMGLLMFTSVKEANAPQRVDAGEVLRFQEMISSASSQSELI